MKLLVVVATAAEAEFLKDLAALSGMTVHMTVSGVGATAAALATWSALSHTAPYDLIVSAGIAGAYPGSGLKPGNAAVSSQIIQADLGAQDGEGFLTLKQLGLSILPTHAHHARFDAWPGAHALATRSDAAFGPMLTLNTVTGTLERAAELCRLHPGALTEGMEGAGVAHAALLSRTPVLEIRGISNPVGPRNRQAWRIPEALRATHRVLEALLEVLEEARR